MNYHYMHINYLLNKYKRKFKVMKTKYYDLKRNYGNYDLFVRKKYNEGDFGKNLIKWIIDFQF